MLVLFLCYLYWNLCCNFCVWFFLLFRFCLHDNLFIFATIISYPLALYLEIKRVLYNWNWGCYESNPQNVKILFIILILFFFFNLILISSKTHLLTTLKTALFFGIEGHWKSTFVCGKKIVYIKFQFSSLKQIVNCSL